MSAVDPLSSLDILVRGLEGYSLWSGPPFSNGQPTVKLDKAPCTSVKFSEDGYRLMVVESDSVITIYDCPGFKEIRSFQIPNIASATLSPCGTYLQTFQKPTGPQEKNVTLWLMDTGAPLHQHFQKNLTKSTWPSICFSSDEAVACRMMTNEIQFFDAKNFSKGIVYRLRIPGVAVIELSKAGSHVAAYVPESKGIPASVQILGYQGNSQGQTVARRSFFGRSTVQLSWNKDSTGLLVLVQSDVDKTNQSYYGESKLNYLTTDGTHEGLVPLRKEGPVHDARWSYSGSEFAVVYGFMPAKATVFDKKCNPLLELGTGPYNTIRWNPKGKCILLYTHFNVFFVGIEWRRGGMHTSENFLTSLFRDLIMPFERNLKVKPLDCLPDDYALGTSILFFIYLLFFFFFFVALIFWYAVLCLAGFGNLPGDMAFWDYTEKKQLATTKAEWSVTSEWSPDGCYFMTATTAPRLQVDNGIKIFHYNGSLFFKKMFDKLYQAEWRPESPDKFGEISELLKSVNTLKIVETKSQGQGSKSAQHSQKPSSSNPPAQKPTAYRPPHAKNAAAIQADLFGGPTEEMSKNALRNKKKREKQREKRAAEAANSGI